MWSENKSRPQGGRFVRGSLLALTVFVLETVATPSSYAHVRVVVSHSQSARGSDTGTAKLEDYLREEGLSKVSWDDAMDSLLVDSVEGLYVFRNQDDRDFLKVVEKLPAGGMGRLLRYRGATGAGRWIDLEFIYEDKRNVVTVVDHVRKSFIRVALRGDEEKPRSDFFPVGQGGRNRSEVVLTQSGGQKYLGIGRETVGQIWPSGIWNYIFLPGLFAQEVWNRLHVRGPPVGAFAL